MAPIAVVDSSVVLKWFLEDEEHVQQAQLLRDDCYYRGVIALIAPDLMIYETLNSIVTATRRKRIPANEAPEIISDIIEIGVELKEIEPYQVLELCQTYNIVAYDAAYLALAESLECDLWTGDRAFYNAVKDKSTRAKWIGFYTPAS